MDMADLTPTAIIDQMMRHDAFTQWLGADRIEAGAGHCTLRMTIRPDMLNGHGTAHGGITYSLADSALAFASNSRGNHAVSIETSIAHLKPLRAGDVITATATEDHRSRQLGLYRVLVHREDGSLVAVFKGNVFIQPTQWEAL
jgi:acyl-CoA thioesterase